ncbi:hypothetical protein Cgig2_033682 [Carnegiea gigantea]|uniref:Secreted protein n=1 Tax=Carnegiea gigantea TaxID=171969 RepID=A0A9Q1JU37_9CARY|nr:hypothetical protein Cgig2_033682 [Carnegiea gigantea]
MPRVLPGLSLTLITCLPWVVSPPTGTSSGGCISIVVKWQRLLIQTETADHEQSTVTGLWGRLPRRGTTRARDDLQGQLQLQCRIRRIPGVLAGWKNRSKLHDPRRKLQAGDACLSIEHPHGGKGAPNAEEATADDLGTETTQCTEIDRFLKRGLRFVRREREPARPEP